MRIFNANCLRSLAAMVLVAGGLITAASPQANADGSPDPHATQAVTAIDLLAERSEHVGAREVGRRTDLRSARGGYQYAGSEDAVVTVSKSTGMVEMHGGRHDLTVQVGGVGSSTLVGGDVVMDSAHGYSVIPAPHRDGSVQVIVVIASRSSPARYAFTIGSDVGSTIQVLSSGSALVLDASGDVIAGAAPAWAFDAKGRRVPTHYEVSGDTLVQVIEHAS